MTREILMSKTEERFKEIVKEMPDASEGKFFGALSIRTRNGKNIAFLWRDHLTVKLDEESRKLALNLNGSKVGVHIYNPKKEMKEWVSLSEEHTEKWKEFVSLAVKYVEVTK